ncbi:MAG TPA: rhodanese-like domain-containing protein [bacterium]|nr:rhodanese-like domain-containing protein [bacterium]
MTREELEITAEALKSRIEGGNPPILIDVREPFEWEINRLPGAVFIPMRQLGEVLEEYKPTDEIVLYCHHGRRSLNAVLALREHGFTNTKSMAGGIEYWSQRIDPAVPRY